MTDVQVPAHWVAQSYLPPICARHGGPATSFVPRKFYTRAPGWSYVLILVSLLIFAIVTLAMRTTVATRLPTCGLCVADRRRFIAVVIGLWVATISVIVLGVQLASDVLVLFGFFVIVLDLLACFTGDYFRVGGHVSKDRAWVTLKRVDATFASAITNALRPAPQPVAAVVPHQAAPYQAAPQQAAPYQAAPQQAAPPQPAPNQAAPYQPSPYLATPDILPGR